MLTRIAWSEGIDVMGACCVGFLQLPPALLLSDYSSLLQHKTGFPPAKTPAHAPAIGSTMNPMKPWLRPQA